MLEAVNRCGGNPPAFCAGFYQGGTAMAGVLMTLGGAHCNCAPPFFRTSLPRFHRPGEGIGEFPVNSLPRLDFSLARLGNPCYNDTTQHIERLDVLLFRSVERNSKTERIDTMSASREKKQRRGSSSGKSLQLSQEQAAYQRKVRTYTAIGVVTVVLVAALLIWNSGFFQSRAIAAKVGDTELSVTELSYYYNDARYIYAQYVLDSSKSDAEQMYNEEEGITYRDYFLEQALENAQRDQALYAAAIEAGHSLDEVQEQLSEQIAAMKKSAATSGYSYASYLKAMAGRYMTPAVYEDILAKQLLISVYASEIQEEKYDSFTAEDLEAYYKEHSDEVDTFDYSYLYFKAAAVTSSDAEGNERTEEEIAQLKAEAMEAAKAEAEKALASYNDGTALSKVITQSEPDNSSEHASAVGSANLNSVYRDQLLDLEANQAALVEYTDNGYYVVVFHSRARNEALTADVRHILIRAETTTDDNNKTVAPSDEAWSTAETKANEILAEFEAGEHTAEAFGALAEEYSEDGGSNTNGGLYERVADGDFVEELNDWMFDEAGHQPGDTAVIRHEGDTSSSSAYWGYHVVYFQDWNESVWASNVRNTLTSQSMTQWQEQLTEPYQTALADGAKHLGN